MEVTAQQIDCKTDLCFFRNRRRCCNLHIQRTRKEQLRVVGSFKSLTATSSLAVAANIKCNFHVHFPAGSNVHMSHFAYACKTEGQNGISRLISELLRTLDSLRDRLFDVTEWRFLNPLIMQTCQYFVLSCLNRHVFLQ